MLMELLQGESLQTRLERESRLSLQEACSIVLACADVLCAAHRVGIIHRDLKPANIFLSKEGDQPEVTKLLDFGISTFCSDLQSISLTATPRGSVIGTPLYMSPEQMLGEPVDRRADIYALGAVLYELVSGQPPFQADCYGELVVKVTVEASPPPLEDIAPVDRQFAAVVARAMARRPEDRFATMEELIFALRPYAESLDTSTVRAIGAPPRPAMEREPTPKQVALSSDHTPVEELAAPHAARGIGRRGLWSAALGLGAAALAVVGAHWIERSSEAASARSPAPYTVHLGSPHPFSPVGSDSDRLPGQQGGWDRPSPPEVLTGRAAPDYSPSSASHGKRSRRGASGNDKVASREPGSQAAREAEALPSKSRLGADSGSGRPGQDRVSARKPQPTGKAGDDVVQNASKRAPAANRNTPDRVQIRRDDFGATPVDPNGPLPKASVSRSDF